MAAIVFAKNNQEIDSLMKIAKSRNQEYMIMAVDLDQSLMSENITDELYCTIPYKGIKRLIDKYGDDCPILDVTSCIGIYYKQIEKFLKATNREDYNSAFRGLKKILFEKADKASGNDLLDMLNIAEEVLEFNLLLIVTVISDTGLVEPLIRLQYDGIKNIFDNNIIVSIPVFEYSEYRDNPRDIEDIDGILKTIQKFILTNLNKYLDPRMTIAYYRYTRRLFSYINKDSTMDHRALRVLLYEYGVPLESIPPYVDKVRRNDDSSIYEEKEMRNKIRKLIISNWYSVLKNKDISQMNRYQIMLWMVRLDTNFPQNASKKELKEYLKDAMNGIDKVIEGKTRDAYEEMSNVEIQKVLLEKGITDINPFMNRGLAIQKILEKVNGIESIPSIEKMKEMSKLQLWDIFELYFYDRSKHKKMNNIDIKKYSKKAIIELICECLYDAEKERMIHGVTIEDIESLSKEDLYNKLTKDCVSDRYIKEISSILDKSDYKDKLIRIFHFPYKFEIEGKEYKTKEEMEEMDKGELTKYGNLQFNANVNVDMKRKDIIKEILKLQKSEKKIEEKIAKKSEITYDNLKKMSMNDLYEIAKKSHISYDYCSSKKKMVERILKAHQPGYKSEKKEDKKKDDPFKEIKEYRKQRLEGNSLGMTLLNEKDLKESGENMSDLLKMVERYQREMGEYEEDYIQSQVEDLQKLHDKVSDLNNVKEVKTNKDEKIDKDVKKIKDSMNAKRIGNNLLMIDGIMINTSNDCRVVINRNNPNNNQKTNDDKVNIKNNKKQYDREVREERNNKEDRYARMNSKLSKIFNTKF